MAYWLILLRQMPKVLKERMYKQGLKEKSQKIGWLE